MASCAVCLRRTTPSLTSSTASRSMECIMPPEASRMRFPSMPSTVPTCLPSEPLTSICSLICVSLTMITCLLLCAAPVAPVERPRPAAGSSGRRTGREKGLRQRRCFRRRSYVRLEVQVRLDQTQGLIELRGRVQPPPLPRVPAPHDVEVDVRRMLVGMIEARERRIELLSEIAREARAIARDEAVLAPPPFADDVDGVVELGRADLRQKPRLQDLGNEAVALGADGRLLVGGEGLHPYALP